MHAFISYVSEDKGQVLKIAEYLRNKGINVWLDRNDLQPGQFWQEAIRNAIKSGYCFIACFSANYWSRDKTYMNEELNIAIEELRLRSTRRTWFIPVLLSKCEVPDLKIRPGEYLPHIQWVSLYEDFDTGLKRIINVILPLSNEDTIKRLLNNLQSKDDEVVTSILKILSKMPEFSDPRVFEGLLLAAAGDTSESAKDQIIESIKDHKADAMHMVANMILGLPDNQLNKNPIILLAKMCSPRTISSEYPQVFEKCKNATLSFDVEKLLRPYFTWQLSEEEYRKIKELYDKRKPSQKFKTPGVINLMGTEYIEYTFEVCVKHLELCEKCNHRLLLRTYAEECCDSGDYWYNNNFECAWCGYLETREE